MKLTAYCGLNCADCPAYLAWKNNSDKLREETAKKWSKEFNWDIKVKDINCSACLSVNKPLYKHCYECGVRKCCIEKEIKNCGRCRDYDICGKIKDLHKFIPDGKKVCDEMREKR